MALISIQVPILHIASDVSERTINLVRRVTRGLTGRMLRFQLKRKGLRFETTQTISKYMVKVDYALNLEISSTLAYNATVCV